MWQIYNFFLDLPKIDKKIIAIKNIASFGFALSYIYSMFIIYL